MRKSITAVALALLLGGTVFVLSNERQALTAAVQKLPAATAIDGNTRGNPLVDALASQLDKEELKAAIVRAKNELPGFIADMEAHPEILTPFEKACVALTESALAFGTASTDEAKNEAAKTYRAVADQAATDVEQVANGPFGAGLKNYVAAEQALGNYFSLAPELSTPLLPPSREEEEAKELLEHAFSHISVMRDAGQEQAHLNRAYASGGKLAEPRLTGDATALQARLKELGGVQVCQPVSH
jgi:hypothetical protein